MERGGPLQVERAVIFGECVFSVRLFAHFHIGDGIASFFEVSNFGDGILGFAPALCFTPAEFEQMFERLQRTLDTVLNQPEVRRAVA